MKKTGSIIICICELLVGILLLINPVGFTTTIIIAAVSYTHLSRPCPLGEEGFHRPQISGKDPPADTECDHQR